tara:strand:+ start:92 stop:295 length:204 start_codon:yes stop_codon:yes gene_type:complete
MKNYFTALLMAGVCLSFASCSSSGLSGSLPIPFTDPAVNVRADIEVTPLPPKLCVGLDVIPRPEEGE